MDYEIIVGLEVHAELSTKSKVFCSCKNSFGAAVNTQICPVCMGFPGTLPTLNERVVDYAIKMGHALDCDINRVSKQDRKNYFYPDLPKAYQISQFDIPICGKGELEVILGDTTKKIGITRIHIEEDAGKLIHLDKMGGTLVDMNRCGVPLIEIVSEPDMRSSEEARAYLETIKLILQYLDISDCRMQEGSIRCDVNVSVREKGSNVLGTRTEMKNVNSFSGAQRAIDYEAARQIKLIEAGEVVTQQTLRWDDKAGKNILLRSKEDAHDYRYFREPDLQTIEVTKERVQELKDEIPELPHHRALRYMRDYSLPSYDSQLICEVKSKSDFFERCLAIGSFEVKPLLNWILGDINRILNERGFEIDELELTPENLVKLSLLVQTKQISNTAGKTVLEEIVDSDTPPSVIVKKLSLGQINSQDELQKVVSDVVSSNPKAIEDYKNGKTNAVKFLIGQCMRVTKGKANPAQLNDLVITELEK